MKIAGFLLLLSGWLLLLSAVALLPAQPARGAFAVAALGVEALGFTLTARAHLAARGERS